MHKDTILIVDDEDMVIRAIQRTLNLHECRSVGTTDPEHALDLIQKDDIAVIISDQKMPRMNGLDLLAKARLLSPDTVRILMTAYSDIDVVISAINEGHIFRYLSKPWKDGNLLETVTDSIAFRNEMLQQKRISTQILSINKDWRILVDQLNEKINRSVENSIKALQKIVSIRDNELLQHSLRVSKNAWQIADMMKLSQRRKEVLRYASIFHDIGKIAIRDNILYKPGQLDEPEFTNMKRHPVYGAEILLELGLEKVAEVILQHHEKVDGSGYPYQLMGDEIILEAKILSVADYYDALVFERVYGKGLPKEEVLKIMANLRETHLDLEAVNCLIKIISAE